ncbi:MAG: 4Fe-4S binding protein [Candidatus Pacebacteria bacterium]|nr:4Fe-4S binding protein [Candidatus Paceibacterota bacterium]
MGQEGKKPKKSGNKAVINREKCKPDSCLKCEKECRLEAISIKGGKPEVDMNECFGCGDCADICPQEAIKILWTEGTEPEKPRSKFVTW